jgi:hypothetical protein
MNTDSHFRARLVIGGGSLAWSNKVIAGCRGHNARLEKVYDAKAMEAEVRLT